MITLAVSYLLCIQRSKSSYLNDDPQNDVDKNGFGKKLFSSFDANNSLCKYDGAKHPRLRAQSLAPDGSGAQKRETWD